MTDKLTTEDVHNEHVERDEDGNLIPDTYTIEFGGQEKELDVYPITGGLGNKLAKYAEGLAQVEPEAVAESVSAACPNLDLTADDVRNLELEKIRALIEPITQQMPEVDPEGN